MAVLSKAQWRRRRRRMKMIRKYSILAGFAVIVVLILLLIIKVVSMIFTKTDDGLVDKVGSYKVKQNLLTVSEYSRPGIKMDDIVNIVIHSTGVAGTTAAEKRDYYESMKDKKDTTESVHFVVDLDGSIQQLIPVHEVACASMSYNENSIAIEYCETGTDGSMTEDTYQALLALCAYLCDEYDIDAKNVIRHYDVTASICPRIFVQNPDSWTQFGKDLATAMKGDKVTVTSGAVYTGDTDTAEPTATITVEPTAGATIEPTAEPTGE